MHFSLYFILLVYKVIYDYEFGKFHEIEDDVCWYVLRLILLIVGFWACDGYRGDTVWFMLEINKMVIIC